MSGTQQLQVYSLCGDGIDYLVLLTLCAVNDKSNFYAVELTLNLFSIRYLHWHWCQKYTVSNVDTNTNISPKVYNKLYLMIVA